MNEARETDGLPDSARMLCWRENLGRALAMPSTPVVRERAATSIARFMRAGRRSRAAWKESC